MVNKLLGYGKVRKFDVKVQNVGKITENNPTPVVRCPFRGKMPTAGVW
jgi:hypothetical protein